MKRSVMMIAALAFMFALFTPLTSAYANWSQDGAQDPKAEEAALYKAWYDANQAKDFPKAIELAKEFLTKFPSGQNAAYLKDKWLPNMRGFMFNEALKAKNVADMIRIGTEALATDAENLDYLYLLAINIRELELAANPANFAHSTEGTDFTQRSIRLIESGKKPTVIKDWKQNDALAYLYQTLAIIEEKNKNTDKALEYYAKSGTLKPTEAVYFFNIGRINQDFYLAAVQKFQAMPEADRNAPDAEMKPEVKAARDEVNKRADAVINSWARFLALTTTNNPWGATRDKIKGTVTELYKYRHPDSPEGLQKLIDHYSSGATTPPPPPAAKPNEGTAAAAPSNGAGPPTSTNVAATNKTAAAAAPEKKPAKAPARSTRKRRN